MLHFLCVLLAAQDPAPAAAAAATPAGFEGEGAPGEQDLTVFVQSLLQQMVCEQQRPVRMLTWGSDFCHISALPAIPLPADVRHNYWPN